MDYLKPNPEFAGDPDHLKILHSLKDGSSFENHYKWNRWRKEKPLIRPDLRGIRLDYPHFYRINLEKADLRHARINKGDWSDARLGDADFRDAVFAGTNLTGVFMDQAKCNNSTFDRCIFTGSKLKKTDFSEATLTNSIFHETELQDVVFHKAILRGAKLSFTDLSGINMEGADLSGAILEGANLSGTNLHKATLIGADLTGATLVKTDLRGAKLSGSKVYGISVWDVTTDNKTEQDDLVINSPGGSHLTVGNIKVAQFIHLLIKNPEIRDALDAICRKMVLILGNFNKKYLKRLHYIQGLLREHNYVPMLFDFTGPETQDWMDTIRVLAGLSKFVIADLSGPRSVGGELEMIVRHYAIPYVFVLEKDEKMIGVAKTLRQRFKNRVLRPKTYKDIKDLRPIFKEKIIQPAEEAFIELIKEKQLTEEPEDLSEIHDSQVRQ